jgi:hypothetical protein
MAFGSLKGVFIGSLASITNPFVANTLTVGSGAVSVGDLIFVVVGQQTALTFTACADNLTNTYVATAAGIDAGTATGRAFYSRVTNAGTITAVNATCTASANDAVIVAAIFEGPFIPSPVDAAINNISSDTTSPLTCPSTGTLTQAKEVVIGWGAFGDGVGTTWSATSPNLKAYQQSRSAIGAIIGYQTVAATTAVAPEFTTTLDPTVCVLGTTAFKGAKSVTADTVAFTVTGTDASPERGFRTIAGTDSFAISGTAATLRKNLPLVAGGGSFAVTGTDVTLTITPASGVTLVADAGSFAVTGTDASLEHGRRLDAEADTFAVTGSDASLEVGYKLNAEAGSFAISGTDVSLIDSGSAKILSADTAGFAVSGTEVELLRTWKLAAEASGFALTGSDVTLTATATAPPEPEREIGGGPSGGTSRKKIREILDLRAAVREAEERAQELKTKGKAKVVNAAQAAAAVAEAAHRHAGIVAVAKLNAITAALDAATGAKTIAATIRHADEAKALADRALAQVIAKAKADADEEEEAIALLLLMDMN